MMQWQGLDGIDDETMEQGTSAKKPATASAVAAAAAASAGGVQQRQRTALKLGDTPKDQAAKVPRSSSPY